MAHEGLGEGGTISICFSHVALGIIIIKSSISVFQTDLFALVVFNFMVASCHSVALSYYHDAQVFVFRGTAAFLAL